jgi:CHAD domain-containing protein
MTPPKWKIRKLRQQLTFGHAATIALKRRFREVKSAIENYLELNTPESLHDARIAIRRLRFTMEIFYACYEKKKYLRLYHQVVGLQDASGSIRDLTIVRATIRELSPDQAGLPAELVQNITNKETELSAALREKFLAFLGQPALKIFFSSKETKSR